MSLLIDALKKAEQEKKEAAKRLKEAQDKSGDPYQLESRTQDQPVEQPDSPEQDNKITGSESRQPEIPSSSETSAKTDSSQSTQEDETSNKDLELTHSHEISMVQEKPPAFELKDITLENPEISDEDDDHDLEKDNLIAPGADKTFALAGLSNEEQVSSPFEDTANATLTGKYSKTISDNRVSRSPVSAAELASDMGGGNEIPTPVAAQTVFSAVASSAGRRQAVEWVVFLGLFTMVLLAAGSFYYLKITPLTPETSSPLVAMGIEANQAPVAEMSLPEVITPADQTMTDTIPSDQEPPVATEGTIDTTPAQTMVEEQSPPETSPVEESIAKTSPAITPAAAATQEQEAPGVTADQAVTTQADLPALPDEIKVTPAVIAISRSRSADKNDQLINSAYALYAAGNYNEAEAEYRKVLDKLPENRDALLGIAAIAYRKGNIQIAYENYLRVIKYYPRDITARTALITMQGGTDPVKSESLIKSMIQEEPDAAFLYFTLGNIYARQSRWADAQQAFFEAYRKQSTNPDYAYNLAVSLDQIGQTRSALDYYHKALELADESQVNFNSASVMTRINTLAAISPQ